MGRADNLRALRIERDIMDHVRNFKAEVAAAFQVALRHYDGDVFKAQAAIKAWLRGILDREALKAKTARKGTA